jgi:hypothetical protein
MTRKLKGRFHEKIGLGIIPWLRRNKIQISILSKLTNKNSFSALGETVNYGKYRKNCPTSANFRPKSKMFETILIFNRRFVEMAKKPPHATVPFLSHSRLYITKTQITECYWSEETFFS